MSGHHFASLSRVGLAMALVCTVTPAIAKSRTDHLVASGKPVSCVQINSIRQTDVRNDRTIDFIMSGNRIYRNTLPHNCPSLGFERRFMYSTSLSQLCSVDIITVLYNSPNVMRGASCGLGEFQPMKKAAK